MMDVIRKKALEILLGQILALVTAERLSVLADMALDFCEEWVLGTESEIDDALVLPLCRIVRSAFGIEDDDGVPAEGEAVVEAEVE